MKILRNLAVAISLYSRIPMPRFEWKEQDMKYNLAFLPLVGCIILGIEYLVFLLVSKLELNLIVRIALFSVVPLLITGGFHLDGYLDTTDALSSYKPKEEKLQILKDPHIGAFAVIGILIFSLVWAGALSLICEKMDESVAIMFGISFVLSRILTGISSLMITGAKKDGMLHTETSGSGRACLIALFIELVAVLLVSAMVSRLITAGFVAVLALFFLYYRDKMKREFGGVTGDTAGYFLCVSELLMKVLLAICLVIRG